MAAGRPFEEPGRERPTPGSPGLPPQRTSFVGREREVDRVKRLLADTRLLTLTGPGGIGKTRLAIEAARLKLANALLSVARDDSRDPDSLKRQALQVMALSYREPPSDASPPAAA